MSKPDAAALLPITLTQRTDVGVQRNEDAVSIGEISRYELETLRHDQEFALYRGRQPDHPSRVLILAPVAEQPTPASLKRLKHEYSLSAELDDVWAARPLALARHKGRLMLVLEDPGGEPLDRALGRPLELNRCLSLAIGIATALGQVHRRGLIHKDIKPANVLVDDAGTVRLTGFGIASRLPRERQAPTPPEVIAGTFAYMAPEQTGLMNRSIDARSDLYSLGITLYEMLTGHLPFAAADPGEWVHCQIARQPAPPGERVNGIPDAVTAIVLKLLAKTAEERYQTAAGLEADLIRCLAEWESLGRIDPFALGAYDASDRLILPGRPYGRERESLPAHLRDEPSPLTPKATDGTPVEDLDLATVVKVSQAVSGEIVLEKLIHSLMGIAVAHSGAERGLLILCRGDELRIEAEATTGRDKVEVRLRQAVTTPADLPLSVLHYVMRTRESVILDDASAPNQFSTDEYIGHKHSRSILCLPLVKRATLIGVLFLENSLTPYAFTPARIAVLRLLASQAAISLENAYLYADQQASEDRLRLVINSIPAIVGTASSKGTIDFINERWQEYTGLKFNDAWIGVIHPDDIGGMVDAWRSAVQTENPFEYQARMRNGNGDYRWFFYRALPVRDEQDKIIKWYVTAHDIDDQRRAEERLRHDEQELRTLVDSVPYLISTLGMDRRPLNVNRETLKYLGLPIEEIVKAEDPRAKVYHPEDLGAVRDTVQRAFSQGTGEDVEARMRRHDGHYRWFLIHYEPLRDENGQIIRWHVTGTDIEDRKHAEERALEENLALREEIDKASMFEEIVGTSAVLHALLDNVSKVARTDSTVLITGETGTGKELIARAIHKRSKRSARAFISVNCAAIPPSLIASELFGHEKGAFTGATKRRLGRFELADGGTIFLDEIGDLPLDTQLALLRVLQEREFERVGGTQSISVNVRVIAATNCDLKAAMAENAFRSDLFYRLNVFPIELPPLRARREDIPLLVEYFIDRYGIKNGKEIRSINKRSLDLLQSYSWPGNIRELQNVIERAVIICEGEIFSVDESWLSREADQAKSPSQPLFKISAAEEKETIEAALAETRGRVSGRLGAAIKLGIPASTLDSKIKALKIDKIRFKSSNKDAQ
jgi:PAS domain S-box-containing protein